MGSRINIKRLYEVDAELRARGVELATPAGLERARKALADPDCNKPDHSGFSTLDGEEISQADYMKATGRG